MEILTLLASASNVYEIVGELTEYARDINPDIAREAVKAVGRIALTVRWQGTGSPALQQQHGISFRSMLIAGFADCMTSVACCQTEHNWQSAPVYLLAPGVQQCI